MALAAEAFGNKMCFLEDITLENVTPDFPACIFVLEQSLSVRALQEVVNSAHESTVNYNKLSEIILIAKFSFKFRNQVIGPFFMDTQFY
jgi:hypothetical protein